MAKRSVPASPLSTSMKPKPTIRFELADGLPGHLPQVNQDVTLTVKGKLVKVAAKGADYDSYDCITVQPSKVTVEGGGKKRG
mgnify:CR=1 FL=1